MRALIDGVKKWLPGEKALYEWSVFFLSSTILLTFARGRLLYRSELGVLVSQGLSQDPNVMRYFIYLPSLVAQDFLVAGVLGGVGYFIFRRTRGLALAAVGVIYSVFGIMFQIKMGQPLTAGLLGQAGGIFEMSASIQSPSYWRSYLIIAGAILFFIVLWRVLGQVLRTHQRRTCELAGLVLALSLVFVFFTPVTLQLFSLNPVMALLQEPPGPEKILKYPIFQGLAARSIERELWKPQASGVKKNIVLLLMETFTYKLIENDSNFAKIMPKLYARKNKMISYHQHFTPWPLSSKALYSVICGEYPHPSNFIEIRLFPDFDCHSWVEGLKSAGYLTRVGYSGDFSYDQMGAFLKAQGFDIRRERKDFLASKPYAQMSWGLDDQALVDDFEKWLPTTRGQPFLSLFIPINSHHPFWTPDSKYEIFQDPYWNSFHYQDEVIDRVFRVLEDKNILKDTVVLITGDHGPRFASTPSPGTLAEESFHVPLWIYSQGISTGKLTEEQRNHRFPTSHIDLGGWILEHLQVAGERLKGHTLVGGKPTYLFYDMGEPLFELIGGDGAWLFNGQQGTVYQGKNWVTDLKSKCEKDQCQDPKQWLLDILHHSVDNFERLSGARDK